MNQDGGGGFGGFTALPAWDQPETGWGGTTLSTGDVDGDGNADLVWNRVGSLNQTYVALAKGDGTFTRALSNWTQQEHFWAGYTLSIADVNGDHRADLVWSYLGSSLNRTYVALSKGDGSFTRLPAWDQVPTLNWAGYKLTTADVNGDGKADLIWNYLGSINRTYVALATGDGSFTRLAAWDQPEGGWTGYTLSAVDVNGDDKADLVWNYVNKTNRTYVATSKGDGTFNRMAIPQDQPGDWTGYTFSTADVSGDGSADLIWSYLGSINRTYVALSSRNGLFAAPTFVDQPEHGWTGFDLHMGDVNGDGMADLVWNLLGDRNVTYVATSNGDGSFSRDPTAWVRAENGNTAGTWLGFRLFVADVNGDGRTDLLWNDVDLANRTYVDLAASPPAVDAPGRCEAMTKEVPLRLAGWVTHRTPADVGCPTVTLSSPQGTFVGEDGATWLAEKRKTYTSSEGGLVTYEDLSVEAQLKRYYVPGITPEMLAGTEPFCVYTPYDSNYYASHSGAAPTPAGASGAPFTYVSPAGPVLALCSPYEICTQAPPAPCNPIGMSVTPCPKCFLGDDL
jgi:hypothetical protein